MKGRLGLLVCGALLVAAAPIWADKAPGDETLKDLGNNAGSAYTAGGSSFGLNPSGMSAMDFHPAGMRGGTPEEFSFSPSTNWIRASRYGNSGEVLPDSPAVAEPGALPMILVGFVGIGLLVRRREEPETKT
ncbi:MAG TPA: hypothetical protein VN861_11970 [Candidatus Acidoferrales bacterium]|nr:hypothetical protein [Candidatus Acidoferrales bacterium]